MRLKSKTAVITGAGRGIGKSVAQKFLKEGAKVLICDLEETRLHKAYSELKEHGDIYRKLTDVTKRNELEDLLGYAKETLGNIDILINNAGIARFEPFLEITDHNWEDTLNINLSGTFQCSQIFAKEMIKQKSGAIVNMGSTNGILGEKGLAQYNASKAGIKLLSKTMAIELAPYNIRVNTVCPGFILTELALEEGLPEETVNNYKMKIPLNRFGNPEEVANAFVFLASDDASFITGTELVIDGGQICQQ